MTGKERRLLNKIKRLHHKLSDKLLLSDVDDLRIEDNFARYHNYLNGLILSRERSKKNGKHTHNR